MFHTLRYNGHFVHLSYTHGETKVRVQHAVTHEVVHILSRSLAAAKRYITAHWGTP